MSNSSGPENARQVGWDDPDRVAGYLTRIGGSAPRAAGEEVLASVLPDAPRTVLDLGCGDGRLAALVLQHRPGVDSVVAVDSSPAMLGHARDRFAGDDRVQVREWSLDDPLTSLGSFDLIVAGFSIHHVGHERKQVLFAEVATQLNDNGVFANLEVVASATPELHRQFLDLIGRPDDDPEDRLAHVEEQLQWMREAGLDQVDCLWRWRGYALLVGHASD